MENLILMSIKTKFAKKIFDGTKLYEYRRKSIGEKNCNKKVFIYSSEIEKAIVGYVKYDKIFKGDINYILEKTNNKDDDEIIEYFKGCNICYAFKIANKVKFKSPIHLSKIKNKEKNFVVPQFFRYIKENEYIFKELKRKKL